MPHDRSDEAGGSRSHHMTGDEFRRHGRAVVDWIADYYDRIESLPVMSTVSPGEIRSTLPADPPADGEPFEAILRDVDRLILPGITHWQSPNFFAYFPANASGPAILGDLLSSGLGVQGMLWVTSPACTELETHVMDWMVEMLGLPQAFRSGAAGGGVIQDTASSASLCAILAARERATGRREQRAGMRRTPDRLRVEPGALVDREGDQGRGDRAGQSAADTRRRSLCDESRRARRADRGRQAGGARSVLRLRDDRDDFLERDRPSARDRADLPRARPLDARGWSDVRHRGPVPRVPLHPGRSRVRRQLLREPAQVDVHELRLRLLLRGGQGRI